MKNLRIFLVLVIVSCLLRPTLMVSNRLPGSRIKASRHAAPIIPLSPARFTSAKLPFISFTGCPTAPSPCVQAASGNNGSPGTTRDIAFSLSQTAGHMNYASIWACGDVGCTINMGGATCSITDDHAQTYFLISANTFGAGNVLFCTLYFPNIASGSNTLHVTTTTGSSGTNYNVGGQIIEWSGLATSTPLDTSGVGAGTGTTMSASATTTHTNDLILGSGLSTFPTRTAGSGYVFIDNAYSTDEEKVFTGTPGSQTADMTNSASANWVMNIAAFKCATDCGGGGGGGGGLTPAQKANGFFILPF